MNRPLVYYCVAFLLGAVSFSIYNYSLILFFVFITLFIVLLSIALGFYEVIFNMMFFILGFLNLALYFNTELPNTPINLRIIENKSYITVASYKGKNVILVGEDLKKVPEGTILKVQGDFKKESQYDKGIIGKYYINKEIYSKKDFITKVSSYRKNIESKFMKHLGEKRGAIVNGVCFGSTNNINKEDMDIFRKLGIIHVVSVSGFHIAIIYSVIELVFGMNIALILCFLYVIFTGLKASTIRAFLMILILKSAKKVYRNYDNRSSLSLSAMILMLFRPYSIFDVGFCLSFLCTLGIIVYLKRIKKLLYKIPEKLNNPISIALSAQVFSFPYMVFTFESFNLGFLMGNVLLLPLYSAIVILGNLAFVVLMFPKVFNIIVYALNLVFEVLEGGLYILSKICPPTSYMTYMDGLIIISIYLSYLLFKSGYKKFRYFPLFLIFIVFFQYYSLVPCLNYIKVDKGYGFILKYKFQRILVSNENNQELVNKFSITQQKTLGENYIFKLGKGRLVQLNSDNGKQGTVKFLYLDKENKVRHYDTIFTGDTEKNQPYKKIKIIKTIYFTRR